MPWTRRTANAGFSTREPWLPLVADAGGAERRGAAGGPGARCSRSTGGCSPCGGHAGAPRGRAGSSSTRPTASSRSTAARRRSGPRAPQPRRASRSRCRSTAAGRACWRRGRPRGPASGRRPRSRADEGLVLRRRAPSPDRRCRAPAAMSSELFLRGLAIGFAVAFALGPIGLLVIRRTIDRGWAYGFLSGVGVATADATYGAIAAFGLTAVSEVLVGIDRPLGIVGGAVLIVLAATLARGPTLADDRCPGGARGTRPARRPARAPGRRWSALTLTNPATILSFAALFASIGAGTGGVAGAADGRRRRVPRLGRLVGAPHRPHRGLAGAAHPAGHPLAQRRVGADHRRRSGSRAIAIGRGSG